MRLKTRCQVWSLFAPRIPCFWRSFPLMFPVSFVVFFLIRISRFGSAQMRPICSSNRSASAGQIILMNTPLDSVAGNSNRCNGAVRSAPSTEESESTPLRGKKLPRHANFSWVKFRQRIERGKRAAWEAPWAEPPVYNSRKGPFRRPKNRGRKQFFLRSGSECRNIRGETSECGRISHQTDNSWTGNICSLNESPQFKQKMCTLCRQIMGLARVMLHKPRRISGRHAVQKSSFYCCYIEVIDGSMWDRILWLMSFTVLEI